MFFIAVKGRPYDAVVEFVTKWLKSGFDGSLISKLKILIWPMSKEVNLIVLSLTQLKSLTEISSLSSIILTLLKYYIFKNVNFHFLT